MTDTQPMAPTDAEIFVVAREVGLLPGNSHPAPETRAARKHSNAVQAFARAVLAKWGTPAPVGVEPFAWADDGSTRSGATATSHRVVTNETKKSMPAAAAVSFTVPLYTAEVLAVPLTDKQIHAIYDEVARREPYAGAVTRRNIVRAIEAAHGIKGGQHGTE